MIEMSEDDRDLLDEIYLHCVCSHHKRVARRNE